MEVLARADRLRTPAEKGDEPLIKVVSYELKPLF